MRAGGEVVGLECLDVRGVEEGEVEEVGLLAEDCCVWGLRLCSLVRL